MIADDLFITTSSVGIVHRHLAAAAYKPNAKHRIYSGVRKPVRTRRVSNTQHNARSCKRQAAQLHRNHNRWFGIAKGSIEVLRNSFGSLTGVKWSSRSSVGFQFVNGHCVLSFFAISKRLT